jgi:hydrogenase-4 component F
MTVFALSGFVIPPLITAALFFALAKNRLGHSNTFLSAVSLTQALVTLGFSIFSAAAARLPLLLAANGYLFLDRLALYEVLITSAVFALAAIYARGYVNSLTRQGELDPSLLRLFYGSLALLELIVILGFLANNLALEWILVELSTLLSAALIVTLKARENIIAALKYVFVAGAAMLFSFIGIIILFAVSRTAVGGGTLNWTELMAAASGFAPGLFNFAFVFLFIGFAAKAGIVPFHTWLPQAYVRAPSVVAVVSGSVLNLGMYVLIRLYALGHQAGGDGFLNGFLVAFGLLSMLVATLSMIPRTNTKKLIAFSGIEQMGLILIALGLGSPAALFWALFIIPGNVLTKALLFFSAGIWHRQYLSNKFFAVKQPFKLQPLASWGLIIGSAAAAGAPALPIFLSEFNILSETARMPWLLAAALFCLLLAVAGFGTFFVRVLGQDPEGAPARFETPLSMKAPVILGIGLLLMLGLYLPPWLTDLLHNIVADLGF